MDNKQLLARVKEDEVKFISLQFTDVMGVVKSVDIPAARLEGALEDGIWFDGSSVEGFARIQESDMHLVPDIETYAVLPWTLPDLRRASSARYSNPMGSLSRVTRAAASSDC
jgi:glutamine synthetase